MKKVLLFTAAALLSSVCFFSCNKNNGGSTEEPTKEPAKLEDPAHVSDAMTINFKLVDATTTISVDKYKVQPQKVIFTESGRYVFIGVIKEITKAGKGVGETFTKTGKYSKNSDGSYQMPGVGSVSTASNPGQGGSTQTQASITDTSGATTSFDSTVSDAPSTSGGNDKNMVRSWVPEGNVHVDITSKNVSTNVGPSMESIAKYLADHGVNVNVEEYVGYVIEDFTMSKADNSFIIAFQNSDAYVGNWDWSNKTQGSFTYHFETELAGELISGDADGSVSFYSENNVNKCDFGMSASAKGVTAILSLTLREE